MAGRAMTVEGTPWYIPAATESLKHRDLIKAAWNAVIGLWRRRKSRIAFTGMSGSGKSVLLDHLTGRAFSRTYSLPEAP